MQKLYCYIDESGQDTKGTIFIVAIAVVGKEREELIKILENVEATSGKKRTKWNKTKKELKEQYFTQLIQQKQFANKLYYYSKEGIVSYQESTLIAVAQAITASRPSGKYKASIFIDGLRRSEIKQTSTGLRKIGIKVEKVRGVKDESNAFIRLADALAGLCRNSYLKQDYAQKLLSQVKKKLHLKELN